MLQMLHRTKVLASAHQRSDGSVKRSHSHGKQSQSLQSMHDYISQVGYLFAPCGASTCVEALHLHWGLGGPNFKRADSPLLKGSAWASGPAKSINPRDTTLNKPSSYAARCPLLSLT